MSMAASRPASEPAIVVMGVSGCGKSSVGAGLADTLDLRFVEGDVLHPDSNVAKMAKGIPLTDADRWPWLDRVAEALSAGGIVSCSALKRSYRDRLRQQAGRPVAFVFLRGSAALLAERMASRSGHFMPLSLLDSQLATLEDPSAEPGTVAVDIAGSPSAIVAAAATGLRAILEPTLASQKETLR